MADIAASDITITILNQRVQNGMRINVCRLAFANGVLTYPAGGVPITKAKLGCPNDIVSLKVFDKGTSGYEWSYDKTNEKLVAMQAPAQTHAHDLKIIAGVTEDEGVGIETTGGPILGSTTGFTVAKADSATKGGVLSETLAAAALGQPSAVAIAAQSLVVEVTGW